ncbi:MAG: N-acetylmuramoyl-L-alanine amidase [Rhodanobacteraceae bacterium]
MRESARHFANWSWLGLPLGLMTLAVQAQTVQDMRVADAAGHTRAVIDLSAPVQYRLFQLSKPDRIVIDLDRADLGKKFELPQQTGSIERVRSGHHGKNGLRLVLDMKESARPKSFLLQPGQKHGYRLVVDLYSDPLLAEKKAPVVAAPKAREVVVAIDAGHGGIDPGATGPHGTHEKDITLKVARDLAREIDKQPGMKAVLTRDGDTFIPLKRRYQIAREHDADLFISVHADAFRNKTAQGSSVWVLSPRGKTSEAARWLADRENRADLVGGVSLDDKDDTLAAVLLDLSQGASMQISNAVARNVLHALARLGPTHRGYVEHANFVVLRSPDVPSILVETAFITNPHEERQLRSSTHRKKLADAILEGVKNYFESSPPVGTWFALQARKRGDRHVVARGETLSAIAHQYGVSIAKLQQANEMADSNSLRAGAVLMIPTG